jgi:hypothetical protein
VKYFRNEIDVGAGQNILLSLKQGKGVFLKINNDYSVFKEGSLRFLLNEIYCNSEVKPVLYFHNGNYCHKKEIITDFNDILKKEKWSMSWIGCYGYWRDDFQLFENPEQRIDTLFPQLDWFIRSFKKKKKIVCLSMELTSRFPFKEKQGGYNFIEVHARNFLIQFKELVDEGILKETTIEYVIKKDLLPSMVLWLLKLKIANNDRYSYNTCNGWKILNEEFGMYSWYYFVLLKSIFKSLCTILLFEYFIPLIGNCKGHS